MIAEKTTVLELVVYKIHNEFIENFANSQLELFRECVMGFEGVISYTTYKSHKENGVFVDLVEWNTLEEAQSGAAKVEELQKSEKYAPIMAAFEEIKMFDHLEVVS